MDWKKITRSLFCFLIVICLLFQISPIRAEAFALEAVLVYSIPVIATLIIALGVMPGTETGEAFSRVVNDCVDALESGTDYIVDGQIQMNRILNESGRIQLACTLELVEWVRSWLFESGTVTESVVIKTSGFSGTMIGSTEIYGPFYSLRDLVKTYPTELTSLIRDLGIMEKVAVFNIRNSSPYGLVGIYWGEDGRMMQGLFENPLGQAHASLYGVYSLSDLVLVDAGLVQFQISGSTVYEEGVFYDKSYAEAMPDFLTSRYFAIDWSQGFEYMDFFYYGSGSYVLSIPVFRKAAPDSVWKSSTEYLGKYFASDFYWRSYYIDASDITWGSSTSTEISVSEGLELEQIAPQEQSLQEGYSTWYENSLTVVDSATDEEVIALPIPQVYTYEDASALTQQQVWEGTISDAIDDAIEGTLAGEDTGTFLDKLVDALMAPLRWVVDALLDGIKALFVVSDTFFATKVEALAAKYTYLDTFLLLGGDLKDFFVTLGASPPIIYIDLGAAVGPYYYGGKTAFLDLTWYAQYKPTVDLIISAFIYLWLAWRVWNNLPGLIQGLPGTWGDPNNDIGTGSIEPLRRLNPGSDVKRLGTSTYSNRGTSGRHYTKHEGL